jgi:thymidylate kinase
VVIVDRFFYDNLAHYALGSRRERRLFRLLARALPVPDLAILLMADPSTILTRRPNYAADHIARLHAAYRQVAREFPGIRVIQTDRLDNLTDAVAGHVRSVVRSELARAARVIGADLT